MDRNHSRFLPVVLLLFLFVQLQGCARNPVTGDSDFVLMSEESEIAMGREAHQKILKQYGEYENPALQAYVQRVGEKLGNQSHRKNLYYRFTVLDSDEVNAFALPGGYIYITRGLLAYLNSEAELAAVLGHEIGHVTARHGVRQHSSATVVGILGAVVAARSGYSAAGDLSNIMGTALVRGYGREHELEADRLGAEYLARNGYRPTAMLDVIRVLKNQEEFEKKLANKEGREPRIYHGLFSTHPDNDNRLKTVIEKANGLKLSGNTHPDNREAYLQAIDGIVYGDSEKDGIRRGNHFYHAKLNFAVQFPEGWRLKNLPNALLASSPDNDSLIQLSAADLNLKYSPREFIEKRLRVAELSDGKPMTISGMNAYTAFTEINTRYGFRKTRVSVLFYNTKAYIFMSAAKEEKQAARFDALAVETAKSFHPLRKDEMDFAKPLRIKILHADGTMHFAELARKSSIPNFPEDQLRLMNAMFPRGEPARGMMIKLVE